MTRGSVAGGGYDKKSAAIAAAVEKMTSLNGCYSNGDQHHEAAEKRAYSEFCAALLLNNGNDWDGNLRNEGFDVFQAV